METEDLILLDHYPKSWFPDVLLKTDNHNFLLNEHTVIVFSSLIEM